MNALIIKLLDHPVGAALWFIPVPPQLQNSKGNSSMGR